MDSRRTAPYRGALALDSLPGGYRGAAVGGFQARSQCQSDPARSAGGGNLPALRQRLGRERTVASPLNSNVQWTSPPSATSWAPGRAGSRVTPDGRPMLPPTRPERGKWLQVPKTQQVTHNVNRNVPIYIKTGTRDLKELMTDMTLSQ